MTTPPPARLYLIVEAISGAASLERLRAALGAGPIASVLVTGDKLDAATARPMVELIQSMNVAALIDNDAQLVRTLRADGVHLRSGPEQQAAYTEAREVLGTRYIIGAEAASRDDAMTLGESGADYIAFGRGADQSDQVSWWSEIFEVPCVAFDADGLGAAEELSAAGADFVAVRLPASGSPADIQAYAEAALAAIKPAQSATP